MNVTKTVQRIKMLQDRYVKIQEEIGDRINKMTKPLEKYIKKRLDEEFPDVDFYFLSGFQCGSLSNNWKPQIWVYRVNNLAYSPEGYWYDEIDKGVSKEPPPVPTRRLRIFLKALSEEVGLKITLVCQKPYWIMEEKNKVFKQEEISCV